MLPTYYICIPPDLTSPRQPREARGARHAPPLPHQLLDLPALAREDAALAAVDEAPPSQGAAHRPNPPPRPARLCVSRLRVCVECLSVCVLPILRSALSYSIDPRHPSPGPRGRAACGLPVR